MNISVIDILNKLKIDGDTPIVLSKNEIKSLLPKGVNTSVTDEIIELVNNMGKDTGVFQNYMVDSFIEYLPALKDVKVSLERYTNALKYVTLKQRMSNVEAWKRTFPERYQGLLDRGTIDGISSNVDVYNSTKIVNKLEAMLMLDVKVQYHSVFHQAIMKNVELMNGKASPNVSPLMEKNKKTNMYEEKIDKNTGKTIMKITYPPVSAKVQQDAAASLIDLLKPTEDTNVNHVIGFSSETIESNIRIADALSSLAFNQRESFMRGSSIEDVQVIGHILEEENKKEKE